jgi:ABC-2 type transport system permease protein
MSLDLSPAPGSAPLASMVRSQAAMELRLLARNGEQLLLTLVIPILLLVLGTHANRVVDLGSDDPIDVVAPGVLTLAIMSTAFTSLAIATGFERRYGVLKRLGASPLPRSGLVIAKIAAVALVEIVQLLVLALIALTLGWSPDPAGWLWLLPLAVLGTAAFGSLALFIAGTLRAEATLAVANLVYVLLLVGGAVIVPASRFPGPMEKIVGYLPSGALGEGLRDAFAAGAPSLMSVLVLAAWAVVGGALTVKNFKWE